MPLHGHVALWLCTKTTLAKVMLICWFFAISWYYDIKGLKLSQRLCNVLNRLLSWHDWPFWPQEMCIGHHRIMSYCWSSTDSFTFKISSNQNICLPVRLKVLCSFQTESDRNWLKFKVLIVDQEMNPKHWLSYNRKKIILVFNNINTPLSQEMESAW